MMRRLVLRTVLWIIGLAVLFFGAAGTLAWPGAWVFLLELGVGGLLIGGWLARHDPALLAERMAPLVQPGQSPPDRLFMIAIGLLWCGWCVLMGFDAVRFRLSTVPVWLQMLGASGTPLCLWVTWHTFRANSFAAPVVKLQRERGQRVVDTGPYATVRHPMYAGALLLFLGAPLLLGSWWGLALLPVFALALGLRVMLEERMLKSGLPGYADYTRRVCYRLIPGLW